MSFSDNLAHRGILKCVCFVYTCVCMCVTVYVFVREKERCGEGAWGRPHACPQS